MLKLEHETLVQFDGLTRHQAVYAVRTVRGCAKEDGLSDSITQVRLDMAHRYGWPFAWLEARPKGAPSAVVHVNDIVEIDGGFYKLVTVTEGARRVAHFVGVF